MKFPLPPDTEPSRDVLRSPVRPSIPQPPVETTPADVAPVENPPEPEPILEDPTNPVAALNSLRRKMELVADEFADGKLNRAQFNAVYRRYSEQRTIIERMVERNPDGEAWKQVLGIQGQTSFLRSQFQAQTRYYIVYRNQNRDQITTGGRESASEFGIKPVLDRVLAMPDRPPLGLGRRAIDENHWLILAVGEFAATAVIFSLEPSYAQARLVRDLHADFERANKAALARGWIVPDHMVFPQRALIETSL